MQRFEIHADIMKRQEYCSIFKRRISGFQPFPAESADVTLLDLVTRYHLSLLIYLGLSDELPKATSVADTPQPPDVPPQ